VGDYRIKLSSTINTGGNGGATGNGGSIVYHDKQRLLAVANGDVMKGGTSLFAYDAASGRTTLSQSIDITGGAISSAFSNDGQHLYALARDSVSSYFWMGDGKYIADAEGTIVLSDATAAQVNYADDGLYVTQKGDDTPNGQLLHIPLQAGSITRDVTATSIPLPTGKNIFPLGFTIVGGRALVPFAHDPTGQVILAYGDKVVGKGTMTTQKGDCWAATDPLNNQVWVANTGAQTFSLYQVNGDKLTILKDGIGSTADLKGGPGDVDTRNNYIAAIVHVAKTEIYYLEIFHWDGNDLKRVGSTKIPAASANGVAILPAI
jgi:DNA-binding beta-propeller fold protein YncE